MLSLLNSRPGCHAILLQRVLRDGSLRGRSIHAYQALICVPQGSGPERPDAQQRMQQVLDLPSLSIGVSPVLPRGFDFHRDVSAVLVDVEKAAEQSPGTHQFADRRRHDAVPRRRAAAVTGARRRRAA